jgi:hypothetical protein
MGESQFQAPLGPPYAAEFVGVEETPPRPGTDYGPGWRWRFRITAGEYANRIVSRVTNQAPTLKNNCGKMLQAVTGRPIALNEEVDLTAYVGRRYSVQMEPDSTGKGTRVGTVMVMPDSANGAPAAPASPPAAPAQQPAAPSAPPPSGQQPAPAPPQSPAAQTAPPQGRKFWHLPNGPGQQAELAVEADVQAFITAGGLDPTKVQVMLLGEHDWKSASSFGFTPRTPF